MLTLVPELIVWHSSNSFLAELFFLLLNKFQAIKSSFLIGVKKATIFFR